jgi:acetate kinase
VVDEVVASDIAAAAGLACPENEFSLAAIAAFGELLPGTPQVAAFDTAFFADLPPCARTYALPCEWQEGRGLRRYGRQGLVQEQAALLAAACLRQPLAGLNLLVCHLGPATSVCAIRNGRALDVSAGFTSLEGLPGTTTCGDMDVGLVAHLVNGAGGEAREVARLLAEESGLQGLSGLSGDLEALLAAAETGHRRAELALDVYCYRLEKYLGAYWAVVGELDAIVFASPAGADLPALRSRICRDLQHLGLELDEDLNRSATPDAGRASDVSSPRSAVRILVVSTDEPRMIASATAEAVGCGRMSAAILARRRPLPIGISVHHVHLSPQHLAMLYGPDHELTFRSPLSQPGQYACEETVDLVTAKGRVQRVRVLGPVRRATQVELSRTECFTLGVQAPIRMSGELGGTPGIRLAGPAGAVEVEEGVICARRHLHVSTEEALLLGLRDRDEVSIRVGGERSLIFGEVAVRVYPEFRLDVHLDTDEANAARLDQGAVGYIESIDVRS